MLTYDLSARGKTPIYEYLCGCLRRDIYAGRLAVGEKLPGRRSLAGRHAGRKGGEGIADRSRRSCAFLFVELAIFGFVPVFALP